MKFQQLVLYICTIHRSIKHFEHRLTHWIRLKNEIGAYLTGFWYIDQSLATFMANERIYSTMPLCNEIQKSTGLLPSNILHVTCVFLFTFITSNLTTST